VKCREWRKLEPIKSLDFLQESCGGRGWVFQVSAPNEKKPCTQYKPGQGFFALWEGSYFLTNAELIKALKYIKRKKSVTLHEVTEHLIPDSEDVLRSQLFVEYMTVVSGAENINGIIGYRDDAVFKLSDSGHNLLDEKAKEAKAIRRANLALLFSLLAVLIAAAGLAYNIFAP